MMSRVRSTGIFLAILSLAMLGRPAHADEQFLLKDGQRVVFLGDSNTFAGLYIAYLDGYLRTRFPDKRFELINLGLPSETASGLSEPDHPYPRPDVHTRVEQALAKTRPNVVVICYGMNDGIYYPPSAERLAKYRDGLQKLVKRVERSGASVVLMTPAPFDPLPVRKRLLPASAAKFSWMRPYEKYDDALTQFSDWLLTWRGKKYPVADAHGAILRYLAVERKARPNLVLSGDGIHPNATGHALIAFELLQALHAPAEVDTAEIDARRGKVVRGDVSRLETADGAVLGFDWKTRLPMPYDPQWDKGLIEREDVARRFNRHRLVVTGLPAERYEIVEGDKVVGEATREQLAGGVDLTRLPRLSTNQHAAEAGKRIRQRERLVGLAWLTDVGHKRPDTPKGEPLAQALEKARQLDRTIDELVRPRVIHLELRKK
jgi:lysophospholipase L1-like esterase